jgi:mediator of RNA polymerase II transcription subunit 22
MAESRETQTDVSRRVALDTGAIRRRAPGVAGEPGAELRSAAYLDGVEEEWNRRIDADVEALVDGMADLVGLAAVCLHASARGRD